MMSLGCSCICFTSTGCQFSVAVTRWTWST